MPKVKETDKEIREMLKNKYQVKKQNRLQALYKIVLKQAKSRIQATKMLRFNRKYRQVRKSRLNNQRVRILSIEEKTRLFAALSNNELVKQIVTIALHTGMRSSYDLSLYTCNCYGSRLTIENLDANLDFSNALGNESETTT